MIKEMWGEYKKLDKPSKEKSKLNDKIVNLLSDKVYRVSPNSFIIVVKTDWGWYVEEREEIKD